MAISDFDPEILQDFLTESGELLEQLEGDLVQLEADSQDSEMLNQVFRALHTIKGSASFLDLKNLVAIAHCTESALNAARNEQIVIGKAEMDLLLEAIDVLKIQFDELMGGEVELTAADPVLIATLTDLGSGISSEASSTSENSNTDAVESDEPTISANGRSERTLNLDSSKTDLIDHLASDIEETITHAQDQIASLSDPTTRAAAIAGLIDLVDDLVKTTDFFEIPEMMTLANALATSLEGIETLSDEHFSQLAPRMLAVTELLKEQTSGLTGNVAIGWPTETLLKNLTAAASGDPVEAYTLPDGCNAQDALNIDGVLVDSQQEGAAAVEQPVAVVTDDAADPVVSASPVPTSTPIPAKNNESEAVKKPASTIIEQTIRVEVGRLESLMNLVGELVLQKNRVSALSDDLQKSSVDLDMIEHVEVTADTLDRITGDIQVAVMRTRMQPLDKLFGKYPRLVRDLAKKTGKNINLVIEGGDTEVDRSVIEELGDPLVHLLRNSGDHGIEDPATRAAADKAEMGTIRLVAGHEGSHVCVQIIDDGKGLDRDVIGAKAVERGLIAKDQLAALSDEEVFRFILEAGFSTAAEVSDLSGRGVGMDVVRTNIERKLKGGITIESTKGVGTTIRITIPLTVAIMPAMMVAVADEVFAIPLTSITEIVRPSPDQLSALGEEPVIHLRGAVHPLMSAQEVFDIPEDRIEDEPFVVVLGTNQKIMGLRVSRVIGQQEIVIKPLEGVQRTGPVSGATVRNDGGVSLIMDIAELMRTPMANRASISAV